MTKFTKEHLEEIAELARKATYKPCSMHMTNLLVVCDSEVIEEMARQLLASMEQEPVSYTCSDALDDVYCGSAAMMGPAGAVGEVPLYAAPQLPQPIQPALTVWYGSMPESNGKSNWTAILHRKGQRPWEGITIDRSEYPGRVRYEADRMRHLIGELADKPDILAYDSDAHSGYVEPVTTAYKLRDAVEIIRNSGIEIDAEKIFAERDVLNTPDCWCRTCRPVTVTDMRFVVCPDCGNKRCPHANDHRNACTGSNEPGQEGSAYPAAPQQEVKTALEHGMQRYAGAMQKLSEGDD